jgi:hypothetical protein
MATKTKTKSSKPGPKAATAAEFKTKALVGKSTKAKEFEPVHESQNLLTRWLRLCRK